MQTLAEWQGLPKIPILTYDDLKARPAKVIDRHLFEPYNEIQREFYESERPTNLLTAAFRAGKSRALMERLRKEMERNPRGRFAVVRQVKGTLKETTFRSFLVDVCGCNNTDEPLSGDGFLKMWNKSSLYGRAYNGAEVFGIGLDKAAGTQDPTKLGSTEYTKIFIDEAAEISETSFDYLQGRRSYHVPDKHGIMSKPQTFIATNPASPQHWLWRRLIKGLLAGRPQEEQTTLADDRLMVGFLKTFDNPYLTKEYLDSFKDIPPESNFYKRLILGLWIEFLGRVFDCFNEEKHVVESVPGHTGNSYDFRAIDFGGQNPFCGLWFRYFPETDILYQFREVYWSGISTAEFGKMLKDAEQPEDLIRYNVSDHDMADRLALSGLGIQTQLAIKDVRTGIDEVNRRFAESKLFLVRDSIVARDPKLASSDSIARRIRPQCLLDEIHGYEWGVTSKGVPTDEPNKVDDHGADCIRYGCMSVKHMNYKQGYSEQLADY